MIEILAAGVGIDQDMATINAMKNAVQTQTQILVETKTVVRGGEALHQTIVTRSSAYITSYKIRSVEYTPEGTRVRVLCQVNEKKLASDLVSSTPVALDGPRLSILAFQNQQHQNDITRATEERRALIACQQKTLEKFISDREFRQEFPIKISSVQTFFGEQNTFHIDVQPTLPDFSAVTGVLEHKKPHLSVTLDLVDKQGNVLYSSSSVCFYPWKSVYFYAPNDHLIFAKVKNIILKW